jgi:hypothetical protein
MNLDSSFFLSVNGLFDFDLTFLSEALLFLILSISVTQLFLTPISKEIEEREAFLEYSLKKSDIIINFAYENFFENFDLLLKEVDELKRQLKLIQKYSQEKFENQITFIQKENESIISKTKTALLIKSAQDFSSLNKDLKFITESFFQNRFQAK